MSAALARALRNGPAWLACLAAAACGGNNLTGHVSPTPATGSNTVAVVVNGGPGTGNINTLYTTVTVCLPGSTTNCQTIDHIQVDTMSFGLRLLSEALTLSLPVTSAANGAALNECITFADGYSWGPVSLVDVTISGESAKSIPVHLIGDQRFPTVPSDCSSTGGTAENTVATFGANGLLGIGPLAKDCGATCTSTVVPGTYYSCTSAACMGTTVALASQVTNPITFFATDNNGSIIELPSVPVGGAASVSGTLIFGIDTQSNNSLGTKTVFTLDSSTVNLTTIYKGQTLTSSFIDSGSNAYFFNDLSFTRCTTQGFAGLYCPASSVTLNAVIQGLNGVTTGVGFTVGNIEDAISAQPVFTAFPDVGGMNTIADSFDWGLPFFYGRPVATAIEGAMTSQGAGPFVAF